MKKLLAALSLTLGMGSVFGVSASASEKEIEPKAIINLSFTVDGEDDPAPGQIEIIEIDTDMRRLLHQRNGKPSQGFTTMGAGEWDYIGEAVWSRTSPTFYSGGGDVLIGFYGGSNIEGYYSLWEEDTAINDVIHTNFKVKKDTDYIFSGISKYVDGDNKKAELFLRMMSGPYGDVHTIWLD